MNLKYVLENQTPSYPINLYALEEIEYLENHINNLQKILQTKFNKTINITELSNIIHIKNMLKNETPSITANSTALNTINNLETLANTLRNNVKTLMNITY